MPQFNQMSVRDTYGAGQKDKQQSEFNALRMEIGQQSLDQGAKQFDDAQKMQNTKWLAGAAKYAMENPGALPSLLQEGQRRGILDPNLTADGIGTEQLQGIYDQAMTGLGGPQYSDVEQDGNLIGQRDNISNEFTPARSALSAMFNTPAELRTFQEMTKDLSPEEQLLARQIELGLKPRAGTETLRDRLADNPDLANRLGDAEAGIREKVKFAEMTGSSRSQFIDKAYDKVTKIDGNIRNMDKAIKAIDAGASTGAIESRFFPSFRASTLQLEQLQKELGLDVIGGVTFGALSKGELDLALEVALPTGLQPQELREWLLAKKAAQGKLAAYYMEQMEFLDSGGTIAQFMREKGRMVGGRDSGVNPKLPTDAEFQAAWKVAKKGEEVIAPDGKPRTKE